MENLQTLHDRANDALINNETDKAVEIYNEIIKTAPDDEVAHSQLMDIYYDTDKLKYYVTRANLNIVRGQYEHAINDCKKAINVAPSEMLPHIKLARLYLATKKNLKAIDEFNKVIELDREERSAYLDLISLYMMEKSIDSALNIAHNASTVFKNNAEFLDIMGKLYFDLGDYKNALETAVDEALRAKILLQDNQNSEAKEILDKIESKSPKKEELTQYLSLLAQYYYNVGDYEKTFETLEKYKVSNKPTPVYFQMKALTYEAMKDEFNAHFSWGFCYKTLGKIEEAIMQFQMASNLNPKNKDVLIELAKLYEQNNEKFVSMDYWQKVYEIDGDKTAKNLLADFYYKQGDLRLAQKYGKEIEEKKIENKGYSEAVEQSEGLLDKIMKLFNK